MMEAISVGRTLVDRVITYVEESIEKRQQVMIPPALDALDIIQEEIYRLEQTLAEVATRPSRVVHKSKFIEPITEQQKIIDLAG